jgi:hypothetical protein
VRHDKRLDRLENCLTPGQAAIVWLQEANRHANVVEYIKHLQGQPEAVRPIPRLTDQVARATREAMTGQTRKVVEAAVHRAERDVCFLVKLHHQVNCHLMTEERVWSVIFAALEGKLRAITREDFYRHLVNKIAGMSSREIPYPLEPETANTVSAAIHNHVTTWDDLGEDGTLDDWLCNYLLDHGARELPEGAYMYDDDGKCNPLVDADNEKEVRDCFKDDAGFERFKAGEDYSKGLATITDAEYDAHYGRMVTAIRELVDSGQVQGGTSVYLETVPVPFLKAAPLVEGKWLDRCVVELAELGALLIARGYQVQDAGDEHPLAWPRFTNSSGSEIDQGEMRYLRRQVGRRLERFPGRTREIGGRPCVSFEDYCSWRGRKVKGDLGSSVSTGFTTASWNTWLDARCAKGRLAGVPVARLQCYVEEHDYLVCPDGAGGRLESRASLLSIACKAGSRPRHEEVAWKDIAGQLLSRLYAFRQAAATISQRYYDGEEVLFPDLVRGLAELIKYTEELVAIFNHEVAGKPEDAVDLEAIRQGAGKAAVQQIPYLVDMAKAEALDAVGEDKAALEMVERHL